MYGLNGINSNDLWAYFLAQGQFPQEFDPAQGAGPIEISRLPPQLQRFIEENEAEFQEGEIDKIDQENEARRLMQALLGGEIEGAEGLTNNAGLQALENMGLNEMLQLLIAMIESDVFRNQGQPRGTMTTPSNFKSTPVGGTQHGGGWGNGTTGGGGSGGGGGNAHLGGTPAAGAAPSIPGAATPQGGGDVEQWRNAVKEYGTQAGVPDDQLEEFANQVLSMMTVESSGNPNAVGDGGNSIGLFQMNMAGGLGSGYSADQLRDPDLQFRVMIPKFAEAFKDGQARGLSGGELAAYMGRRVENPAAGLERKYADVYNSTFA